MGCGFCDHSAIHLVTNSNLCMGVLVRDTSVVRVWPVDQVSHSLHFPPPLIYRLADIASHPIAGLAQLGERQTEVKLREIYLKVMCSIHINRTVLYFCFLTKVISMPFLLSTFGTGTGIVGFRGAKATGWWY